MNDIIIPELNLNNKVYVKVDEQNRIIDINSDAFITDFENWIQIDEGEGYKYRHAQGNYFPLSLVDERFIYHYKLVDGVPVERTQEEMEADVVIPEEPETENYEERITALEEQLVAYEQSYAKGVQDA